jgi:RNA-binding protein YlmH
MTREEELFQKRLIDLSSKCYSKDIIIFSDFLNLNELNIFHISKGKLAATGCKTFGGYDTAERQMIAFLPEALYHDYNYPIVCVQIIPLQKKFSDTLTHRDYLGAILNLGIDRNKIGDIIVKDKEAFLYCHEKIAPYICSELTRIKHTSVYGKETVLTDLQVEISLEEIRGTVSSVRLDSLMALAFKSSRSGLCSLIEGKKVFVNGKLITSNAYFLKENDLVSVRGMGRFIYKETLNQTKKGRYSVILLKYI